MRNFECNYFIESPIKQPWFSSSPSFKFDEFNSTCFDQYSGIRVPNFSNLNFTNNPFKINNAAYNNTFGYNINTGYNYTPVFKFSFQNPYNPFMDTFRSTVTPRKYGSLQEKFFRTGLDYVGQVNNDLKGNELFSNGRDEHWCADFVSTLAHKTFGSKLPKGFPDAKKGGVATMTIKSWGEKHDRYISVPQTNIGEYIAKNVKPGDILIMSREGGGHTGIVTKVNSDGSFETVEGNWKNSVRTVKRDPKITQSGGRHTLLGFVQMGDIA